MYFLIYGFYYGNGSCNKNQLGKGRAYFSHSHKEQSIIKSNESRNLEAGSDAKAMEDPVLLSYGPVTTSLGMIPLTTG